MYTRVQPLTKKSLRAIKRQLRTFTDNVQERRALNRAVLRGGAGLDIIVVKRENDSTNKHYTFTIVNDGAEIAFEWNICSIPIRRIFQELQHGADASTNIQRVVGKKEELMDLFTKKLKELQQKYPIAEPKVGRFTVVCANTCKEEEGQPHAVS